MLNVLYLVPGLPTRFRPHFMPFLSTQLEALSHHENLNINVVVYLPVFHYLRYEYLSNYFKLRFERINAINCKVNIMPIWYLSRPTIFFGLDIVTYLPFILTKYYIRRNGIKVDLIHSHFVSTGLVAKKLSEKLGVKYVITEHASDLEPMIARYSLDRILDMYRGATSVICVSPMLKDKINHLDPQLANLQIIPNGVEIKSFKIRRGDYRKRFVFIGHIIDRKGIRTLLQAARKMKIEDVDFRLDIFGKGDLEGYITNFAARNGLVDSIYLRGVVDNNNINDVLISHDVLILPSRKESFGVVVIEALASGLPVIVTKCGGPESIIVNRRLGELIEVGNATQLFEAMVRVSKNYKFYDPDFLNKHVKENFDWEVLSAEIIDQYET